MKLGQLVNKVMGNIFKECLTFKHMLFYERTTIDQKPVMIIS